MPITVCVYDTYQVINILLYNNHTWVSHTHSHTHKQHSFHNMNNYVYPEYYHHFLFLYFPFLFVAQLNLFILLWCYIEILLISIRRPISLFGVIFGCFLFIKLFLVEYWFMNSSKTALTKKESYRIEALNGIFLRKIKKKIVKK